MSALEKIKKTAERDARRYTEAQMDYGRGSGNKRKILNAELKEKMEDAAYKSYFNAELERINESEVARKINKKKTAEKAYEGAKKTIRAARRAENFYYRNKQIIDGVVGAIFKD